MPYSASDHTFVICAYKKIPFLGNCIESLLNQTLKSTVLVTTSTPNDYIKKTAKKYGVKLVINKKTTGHINDFCFAYDQVTTKLATLCHQDDIYMPQFLEYTLNEINRSTNTLIAFSDYYELHMNIEIKKNTLLTVKRIMNYPLSIRLLRHFKSIRLLILSFGCSICAPSVTYNKELIQKPVEESTFKSNIDWDTWVKFARHKGDFVYIKKPLLFHRIHEASTTSFVINNQIKFNEDYSMFRQFWPSFIAKFLLSLYKLSEKSNTK